MPWPFLFTGDPNNLPKADGTIDDFKEFWGSRFMVSVRYNAADLPPDAPVSGDTLKLLFAVPYGGVTKGGSAVRSPNGIDLRSSFHVRLVSPLIGNPAEKSGVR